jgi:hypothetical protein
MQKKERKKFEYAKRHPYHTSSSKNFGVQQQLNLNRGEPQLRLEVSNAIYLILILLLFASLFKNVSEKGRRVWFLHC